jgi:hypothetical protein
MFTSLLIAENWLYSLLIAENWLERFRIYNTFEHTKSLVLIIIYNIACMYASIYSLISNYSSQNIGWLVILLYEHKVCYIVKVTEGNL